MTYDSISLFRNTVDSRFSRCGLSVLYCLDCIMLRFYFIFFLLFQVASSMGVMPFSGNLSRFLILVLYDLFVPI